MEKLTYEQALLKLEETVKELEKGDKTLDESMKLFEQGNEMGAYCLKCIEEARLKIEQISEIKEKQE